MRRDTHLLEKIKGGFCNQVINGYDTAYISIRFDSFKKSIYFSSMLSLAFDMTSLFATNQSHNDVTEATFTLQSAEAIMVPRPII